MSYDRQLEDKTRLTINGKRYRVGNREHPYHEMYKKHGIQAVIMAMGLATPKPVQEPETFPWTSVMVGIAFIGLLLAFTVGS